MRVGGTDEGMEDAMVENILKAAAAIMLAPKFRHCTFEAGSRTK